MIITTNNNTTKQEISRKQEARSREIDANRKSQREAKLDECLDQAEVDYQKFIELNSDEKKETDEGTIYSARPQVWDRADDNKQADIDNCYKRYR